jgi:hypothetical protein
MMIFKEGRAGELFGEKSKRLFLLCRGLFFTGTFPGFLINSVLI